MQKQAKLVIIGAGIVGCSTVYHLTQKGWRDIVVLEQGPLFETGGSTSHAPGLIFQTNSSKTMTELARYTVQLYSRFESNGRPCFYPVGGMEVAQTEARWEDLKRKLGFAKSWGLEAALLTPEEAKAKNPLLDAGRIYGAYFVPSDGIAKAVWVAEAMARAAEANGAVFYGNTTVTGIEVANGRVQAVVTDQGTITTGMVLVCAGIWGPRLGRMVGLTIPLIPVEHQYVKTTPLPELAGETREVVHPILRHQDRSMYFRQHADHYGIGSYQHEPLLVEADDILRYGEAPVMPSVREFTPEHFQGAWEAAAELLPPLAGADWTYTINGMFSFTPDGQPVLGESLDVAGFWVAEAVWVTHGGGVGKVMAEWMVDGAPSLDLREADMHRFHPHALTRRYVRVRGAQQYREVYDIIHPLQQMENPRGLRLSPFHSRLKEQQAVFFESAGWERPQWLEVNSRLLETYPVPERSGWAARYWSPIQGAEHLVTRDRAALYDLTAFTKLEVSGPGALSFLQYVSAHQIDRPVGKVIYTSLLDRNGGIKCDLTITRLTPDRFLVLTGGASGKHDLAWLRCQAPGDGSVVITDVTSKYCNIGLWGPQARQVLQKVCQEDVSNEAFPYFTAQQISIGSVPALALRLSYVGELGWEIYTLTEYGLHMWDTLWRAGQEFDVVAAGFGAFDSLRLEKGYRSWGADIHTDYNPYEAGLDWTVKLDKGDFLGREALQRFKETGVKRKLCCLTLEDRQAVLLGKEPILHGNQVLGYITSANRGYSVGQFIAYGYLPIDYTAEGVQVDIEYFGRRYTATVRAEPLFDPTNERLKA